MPSLEEELGELLRSAGLTLALAESCSGGLIADRVTNVAGSSDYFLGGVVTYSNRAKESVLGLERDLIAAHGAVSAPVASAMAQGVRRLFGADLAVAATGIAGPGGGSEEKPVGLVFLALDRATGTKVAVFHFHGGRRAVKEATAEAALVMLKEHLLGTGR